MEKKDVLPILTKYYRNIEEGYISDWIKMDIEVGGKVKYLQFVKFHKGKLYLTTSQSVESKELHKTILLQVDNSIEKYVIDDYCKLPIQPVEIFDSLLFVYPKYHDWLKGVEDELYKLIVFFSPIHHSEFGGMDGNEFLPISRKIIEKSNWERQITPMVRCKLNKPSALAKSGAKYIYTDKWNIDYWLGQFKQNEDWLDIKNYKDEIITVNFDTAAEMKYGINSNNKLLLQTDLSTVKEYLNKFLIE